eukprot:TRINITY_DN92845_c0_g1_i1.p1 TRINITY_DN92845_c0_g1~~TRINITY_DN92845_c0_g1_i1.p1  ORF type:complete len:305 (+),score=42.05 TRINITY_DN92845_c0_g1_i1:40-954(+)
MRLRRQADYCSDVAALGVAAICILFGLTRCYSATSLREKLRDVLRNGYAVCVGTLKQLTLQTEKGGGDESQALPQGSCCNAVVVCSFGEKASFVLEDIICNDVVQFMGVCEVCRILPVARGMKTLMDAVRRACTFQALSKDLLFAGVAMQGGNVQLSLREMMQSVVLTPEVLTAKDSAHRTLLTKAVQFDLFQHAQALLARKADPNVRGGNGWTPLHFAAIGQSTRIIDLLVSHKADVEQVSADGYLPLLYAQKAGCEAVVKRLLFHGSTSGGMQAGVSSGCFNHARMTIGSDAGSPTSDGKWV